MGEDKAGGGKQSGRKVNTFLGVQQLRAVGGGGGGGTFRESYAGPARLAAVSAPGACLLRSLCARASACPSLPGAPRQFPPPLTF